MKTWSEFIDEVNEAMSDFHNKWGETAIAFFRGHGDASWKLLPGVFRGSYKKYAEECLYYEFRSTAGLLLDSNLNSWDIAFCMQHHGLPTRFLDWTDTFAVALYFAVAEIKDEAAVWMLDPYLLNREACNIEEILDLDADFQHDYFSYFINDKPSTATLPGDIVAIYPRRQNARIQVQKGMFNVHQSNKPLEDLYSSYVRKLTLSKACIDDARRFLNLSGINDFSLFPDLDGLSRHLKKRYLALS
jgi:hypothetical protein